MAKTVLVNPKARLVVVAANTNIASFPPTISSINYNQGDIAGGGQPIVITGTNFTGTTSVTFLGTSASYVIDSPVQITATLPAHAAGTGNVVVTNTAGSASVAFEYWYPGTETECTWLVDSVGPNPYTTTWTPRVNRPQVNPGISGIIGPYNAGFSYTGPPAVGGAPDCDGDALTEVGLQTRVSGQLGEPANNYWIDYIGPAEADAFYGGLNIRSFSIATVFQCDTPRALNSEISSYGNTHVIGNVSTATGVIGGCSPSIDSGGFVSLNQRYVACHVYDDSYRWCLAPVSSFASKMTSFMRTGNVGAGENFTVYANNGTPATVARGSRDSFYNAEIALGQKYPSGGLAGQTYDGKIYAACIFKDYMSSTVVNKWHKWAQQRHGVT